MGKKDPRVDAYIAKSADFARPILERLRRVMHTACPDVVETIKWSAPSFEHEGFLCAMAAFKQYCALGFWKEKVLKETLSAPDRETLEQVGRIDSLEDLPSDAKLVRLIRHAAELNEQDVQSRTMKRREKKPAPRTPSARSGRGGSRGSGSTSR